MGGFYLTFRTGFIQFRLLKESIKVVTEKPKGKNSVSSFEALMISTASRVGTRNIIGVSSTICLGTVIVGFTSGLTVLFARQYGEGNHSDNAGLLAVFAIRYKWKTERLF